MKTAGIVGGIGPESTIDYYRSIVVLYRKRRPDGSYPPVVINSVDLQKVLGFIAAGRLDALAAYILLALGKLAAAGADFAVLASNTPHVAFEHIAGRSPIPLISIVEAAAQAAKASHLGRLGILGTRYTMQGRFYPEAFWKAGVAVVPPSADEQNAVHDIYMKELVAGVFRDSSRAQLLQVVARMRERERIDGVVLAGTELPLLLRGHEPPGIPFLDTAKIHVERIVERLIA